MTYHTPILLDACISGINIKAGGTYVDATFGGGGHAREILKRLTDGKVIGIDQDEDAEKEADRIDNKAFTFIPGNFRFIKKYLKMMEITGVDGILADLGVSSHQFDVGERGFSIREEGDLDMRMDRKMSLTAGKVVNSYNEKELARILYQYGEISNARSLASAIVSARINKPVKTTDEFVKIVRRYAPPRIENKYLARVFQAIRIEVNDELGALSEFLNQCPGLLKRQGRLAVISYHSLEDRMVKNLINYGNIDGTAEKDIYGNVSRPLKPVNKKPVVPSAGELESNSRAKSAKLRLAERV
jgi:16S rRNA (cytosine1402-N4)-methyltransferase